MAISMVQSDLNALIQASYALDNNLQNIITRLQNGELVNHYTRQDELLRRKGKLVLGSNHTLRNKIIAWLHASPKSGH